MRLTNRPDYEWSPVAIARSTHGLSAATPVISGIHVHRTRQDSRFDMHWELEFGVVLSGSMQREYESWKGNLQAGDVWFCGMWEPHGWKVLRTPCEVLVLVILPQMLVNLRCDEAPEFNWLHAFNVPPGDRPQTTAAIRSQLQSVARRFGALSGLPAAQAQLWRRVLLMELLLLLQCDWKPGAASELAPSYYQRINTAVELVFNSQQLVTATQAAAECRMSRNHFNSVFEKLMGLSFARFALRYRLSQAASALALSDRPLKSIAVEWGFTDASHLHHCFVRHYGCSPHEYRRRKSAPAFVGG